MKTNIPLDRSEHIIAVIPESAHGPGWSNQLIHIYIADMCSNTYRTVSLQPHEQTDEQRLLFNVLETAHNAMLHTVMGVEK